MALSGWQKEESPFHEGERAVQTKLGFAEEVEAMGRRMVRDFLTEQHQTFFAQLSYIIVGSVDSAGHPWASILVGEPGFMTAPNAQTLSIQARPFFGDPLANNLALGCDIGLLGIELNTRRRNRVNGIVSTISSDGFEIQVRQAFGNCPKYIQARQFDLCSFDAAEPKPTRTMTALGEAECNIIRTADTFFVATAYLKTSVEASKGVDVSHRGGKPGFVTVEDNTLTIPDYSGNHIFNTIGNIEVNPRAGLLFVDFEIGNLLYLTGRAEVVWSDSAEIEKYEGAERLIRMHVEQGISVEGVLPMSWSAPEYSPFL